MINFTCVCGKLYSVPDDKAGAKASCTECGQPFIVPSPEAVEKMPPAANRNEFAPSKQRVPMDGKKDNVKKELKNVDWYTGPEESARNNPTIKYISYISLVILIGIIGYVVFGNKSDEKPAPPDPEPKSKKTTATPGAVSKTKKVEKAPKKNAPAPENKKQIGALSLDTSLVESADKPLEQIPKDLPGFKSGKFSRSEFSAMRKFEFIKNPLKLEITIFKKGITVLKNSTEGTEMEFLSLTKKIGGKGYTNYSITETKRLLPSGKAVVQKDQTLESYQIFWEFGSRQHLITVKSNGIANKANLKMTALNVASLLLESK